MSASTISAKPLSEFNEMFIDGTFVPTPSADDSAQL
jgi:hypothetical protein